MTEHNDRRTSCPEFGDRVEFTAVVGKLRRRYSSVGDGHDLDDSALSLGHGRRSHIYTYRSDERLDGLDVLASASDMRKQRYGQTTLVDVVRVPVSMVRQPGGYWFGGEPDESPLGGVVVGTTHRQCGRTTNEEYGNQWLNGGAVPVLTVAVETGGAPCFYDVHPDDCTTDPATS